jgi:signal transduction histidine kinase
MRVQQILINLLTNAIKFSYEGGMVFITVMTFITSTTDLDAKI